MMQNNNFIYRVYSPIAKRPMWNYFVNNEYHAKFSQTAQGESYAFSPRERTVNRGERYFYIKNNTCDTVYNPNFVPLNIESEYYECIYKAGYSEIKSVKNGIETLIRMFVPLKGKREIWKITLTNIANKEQDIDLFSAFTVNTSGMGSRCLFDAENKMFYSYAFPYHVKYSEYEDKKSEDNYTYVKCSETPYSYDCGELRFFGNDNHGLIPEAIENGCCSRCVSENDKPLAAPHSKMILKVNESRSLYYILGCCNDIEKIKEEYGEISDIAEWCERQFEDCNAFWENLNTQFTVKSDDKEIDRFVNYWLPKQIMSMNLTHRFEELSCVRNELQDAVGLSIIQPFEALKYLEKVLMLQEESGDLKQWHIVNNTSPIRRLGLLTYYDGPIWLILCACIIIRRTGEISLMNKKVKYSGGNKEDSIYEHLLSAVRFLEKKRGKHGLVLFADGDWTDPLNGMGGNGKGETVWGSEALIFALNNLKEAALNMEKNKDAQYLDSLSNELLKAVNEHCWDGEWYILGYNDEGERVGTSSDTEGRIFLNPQTWSIISGAAQGERLTNTVKTIQSIETPCGPMLNYPPFSEWNKNAGRASLKLSGTTENGAIYCHASMFKAYSDCILGKYDRAYEEIKKTLPMNKLNPCEQGMQIPIFVPNYYYGLTDSPNFGISSNVYSTGTADWMMLIIAEGILGIKADFDGLHFSPKLPDSINDIKINCKYKNAMYSINIKRGEEKEIFVNGRRHDRDILPYEDGADFEITAIV